MRMRYLVILPAVALIALAGCSQKPTDLTYTTNSAQARDYYVQGLDKAENFFFKAAEDLFARAIEADPDFAMAYYQWALNASDNNEFLRRFKMAVERADKVPEVERLVILSTKASNDGDNEKSKALLVQAVQVYPNGKRLRLMMGNFYFGQQDYAAAESEYRKAISVDPNFAPPYNMLAYLLSNLDQYQAAIDALKQYAALRPKDPNPHDSMGEIYLWMGDHENSLKEYSNSLNLDSTFALSFAGLGHNYIFKGDLPQGRAMYEQIKAHARSAADTGTSFFWTASSYCHEGKYDTAIKTLEDQLQFTRAHGDAFLEATIYGQIAEIYREAGDLKKAIEMAAMERQVAERPEITLGARRAYQLDAVFTIAVSYAKMGKMDSAGLQLEEFRKSAEASPNPISAGNLNALEGILAYYGKDYEKAISKLALANSTDPLAKYYRAAAYEAAGKTGEAADAYANLAKYNRNSLSYGIVRPWAVAKANKS